MPPADNRTHLAAAAARRSADARQRATQAIRRLDSTGTPITFAAVADEAHVSRSWLYRDTDLRAEIEQLRTTGSRRRPLQPSIERSSDASLHQRLENLLDDNRALRHENNRLRQQLAVHLGEQRAATTPRASRARTLGPCS